MKLSTFIEQCQYIQSQYPDIEIFSSRIPAPDLPATLPNNSRKYIFDPYLTIKQKDPDSPPDFVVVK